MRILISNDDGYFSPGIQALSAALSAVGEVTVVAPERDRSGASNSLTLDRPLSLRRVRKDLYYVNGTPSDCVHLAVTGMFDKLPDVVVSGVNHGANMGDDTIYSGTVAAAMEGYLLGVPSIAISLVSRQSDDFSASARVAVDLVERFKRQPFKAPILLNVNVPEGDYASLKGLRVTRLGRRHKAEPVIRMVSPRDETVYWIGPAGGAQDAGIGTDFNAVDSGYVSITPLQIDLTHNGQMEAVSAWLV